MSSLPYVFYINLARRSDRRAHLEEELKRLGWKAERFEAVEHQHGAIGCYLSHLACLKKARHLEYPYVCLLEDDAVFTDPAGLNERIEQFFAQFAWVEWDVLLLGANVMRGLRSSPSYERVPERGDGNLCLRVWNAQTTVAYVVQYAYYDTLIAHLEEGLRLLEAEPHFRSRYAIDMYWKSLQRRDRWYTLLPLTVSQLTGYSDIERRKVDPSTYMLTLPEW